MGLIHLLFHYYLASFNKPENIFAYWLENDSSSGLTLREWNEFDFCRESIITLCMPVCLVSSDIVSLVSRWITPPVLTVTTRLFFWVRSEESFWSFWLRCAAAFSMTACFWRSWTSTTLTSVYSIKTASSAYGHSRAVAKWKRTLWKLICRWFGPRGLD